MFSVLLPHGPIAGQESGLFVDATVLMLIVAIPVMGLLFFFAWKYRAGGGARYEPEWEHSRMDELVWWAVPLEIVLVLSAITWTSTHALDPHKALASGTPALRVEAVALPWKWLFIYPDYHVATLNYLAIPAGVPVNFSITADAPMNSLWIPALGGQIYAMTGMSNPLSLEADSPGEYQGMSANYSGSGFADMTFKVEATTPEEFAAWAASASSSPLILTDAAYAALAQPGTSTSATYSGASPALYDTILSKYADPAPGSGHHH